MTFIVHRYNVVWYYRSPDALCRAHTMPELTITVKPAPKPSRVKRVLAYAGGAAVAGAGVWYGGLWFKNAVINELWARFLALIPELPEVPSPGFSPLLWLPPDPLPGSAEWIQKFGGKA